MGVVYRAFDPHIERTVALKTIRKELLREDAEVDLVARFKNEAQASGRLSHPNIVAVYDYGETDESAFIAMEYVEGTALNTLLVADKPTDLPRVMVWMTQLLRALSYAHSRGVVHRDIKPANLIITPQGDLKITDFGIARIESSTLTQTGSMIGTPSYMSPEQFRGGAIDGRSDVFSAAIVLYQLLTGARPFTGTASVVMQQIMNENPEPPSRRNLALPAGVDAVIHRALAKDPVGRYATAEAFLAGLTAAHGTAGNDNPPTLSDSDRTVLALQIRKVDPARLQPGPASSHAGSQAGLTLPTGSAATMTPWKLEAFPTIEAVLSRQIGPIAKALLKKAGARAEGIDEIADLLSAHIPAESGRLEFRTAIAAMKKKLDASGTGTGTGSAISSSFGISSNPPPLSTVTSSTAATTPIDPAFIETAERVLTRYIGAIAKIIVKRTLARTAGHDAFVQTLAGNIESEASREQFVKELTKSF